ncbi:MAG: YihY family inner membrane protein [Acidobacteria bacterium]|nr:YihY family inner membrane protein [Acidobacteriota bacterium]
MQIENLTRSFGRAMGMAARNFWFENRFNDCAAISYYALLSVVPLAALVVAVLSRVMGATAADVEQLLQGGGLLVPEFGEVVNGAVAEMILYRRTIGAVSLAITIWFASFVFGSIQSAFDRIFKTYHPALWGFMKPRLVTLAAAVLLMIGFVFSTMLTVVRSIESPVAAQLIAALERAAFLGFASSFVVDMFVFMLILYTLPPQRLHDWRMVIPAALVGAIGWRAARYGFGIYVGYATERLTFSGSAGAAVIFMLWIYYAALVLLYSAELLAALDRLRREATAKA